MSATVRVTRPGGWQADLLRTYVVLVDGRSVGGLKRGGQVEVSVSADVQVTVMGSIDRQESAPWVGTLREGETVELELSHAGRDREHYLDLRRIA